MGKALEVITVQATAPGAGALFLAAAGNSLTIRDTVQPAWLAAVWGRRQTVGFFRLTSPLLHDAVVGVQMGLGSSGEIRVQHVGCYQRLYAQDTLVAFGSGSAVAGDIEQNSFLVAYEDLPGVDGYFIDEAELDRRADDLYAFQNTLALGTVGGYSGSELINAEQDQLKANTDYAILGWTIQVGALTVRYIGQDWGNLGVGGPAQPSDDTSERWFVKLSRECGMPLIPVFNSSNKSSLFIDGATDENGVDAVVNTMTCRLRPKATGKRQ